MLEARGNLWEYPCDARVITTNGDINAQGLAVMGKGVAHQATQLIPGIQLLLAHTLRSYGNTPSILCTHENSFIVSMPVKYHWSGKANLELIHHSLERLYFMAQMLQWNIVVMPRPGCGNGGLNWKDVRPLCAKLGDNFTIIEW